MITEFNLIDKLFDELFPIMRSITGAGLKNLLICLRSICHWNNQSIFGEGV